MKTASQLLVLAVLGISAAAQAAPGPMGPSAVMAAKLKKAPTPSWMAHYLPDDRYKIAGGVWKYVSTDLDTYVHRPDSPLMLRQSADRVIGFASLADAEEAGYTPEPGMPSAQITILSGTEGTMPLSAAEITYVKQIDKMFNSFGTGGKQPGMSTFTVRRLNEIRKAMIAMKNAPIPPRFASGGQKIQVGINSLFQIMDTSKTGVMTSVPTKEIAAGFTTMLQGFMEVGIVAGRENMRKYLTFTKTEALR